MIRTADLIDRFNDRLGSVVAWTALGLVLVQFAIVILRYAFGIGSIWLQESLLYLFATLFLLTSADALRRDRHVRVDIWHREAPPRAKILVDMVGTLVFLWPVALTVLWQAWPYVAKSVAILEGSPETAGIPAVWLLKAEILAFAALLVLQGLSILIRGAERLRNGRFDEAET